jgi:hypothetical protein
MRSFDLQLLYSVWGQGSSTQHEVGDLINPIHSAAGTHPADGGTLDGHLPDHALLAPELSDALGVVERGCPPAPVLIKLAPVSGLDSEGHEVRSFCMWLSYRVGVTRPTAQGHLPDRHMPSLPDPRAW